MGWGSGARLFERVYNITLDKFVGLVDDKQVVSAIVALIVAFEDQDCDNLSDCDDWYEEGTYLNDAVKLLYPDAFEDIEYDAGDYIDD